MCVLGWEVRIKRAGESKLEHFILPVSTPTGNLYLRASHDHNISRFKKISDSFMFVACTSNSLYNCDFHLFLRQCLTMLSRLVAYLNVQMVPLPHCPEYWDYRCTLAFSVPMISKVSFYSCSGHCRSESKPTHCIWLTQLFWICKSSPPYHSSSTLCYLCFKESGY